MSDRQNKPTSSPKLDPVSQAMSVVYAKVSEQATGTERQYFRKLSEKAAQVTKE